MAVVEVKWKSPAAGTPAMDGFDFQWRSAVFCIGAVGRPVIL
jgi:hypothetical protein